MTNYKRVEILKNVRAAAYQAFVAADDAYHSARTLTLSYWWEAVGQYKYMPEVEKAQISASIDWSQVEEVKQ